MTKHPLERERPGISSGDPQAIEKLKAKIAEFEARREHMKAVNAYYKKHNTIDGCPGVTPEEADRIKSLMLWSHGYNPRPYDHYVMDSVGGSIRSFRRRIAELEKRKVEPPAGWKFEGGEVIVDMVQNCIQIVLDEHPDSDRIIELKLGGFRLSSIHGPWERPYSERGLEITKQLFPRKL